MVGTVELKAHHQLTQQALEIHRLWEDLDAEELLPLAASLQSSTLPLSAAGGNNWSRKENLSSHLDCLVNYLKDGKKDRCWSDIKDLIYADFPALGLRLLTLADQEAKKLV